MAEAETVSTEIRGQIERLKRGTISIVPEHGLEAKLAKSASTGKPLKIKLGLDPTAPDIHLGFAVVLRKLRQFQEMGHEVVIILGDYTALIGDPSGRSATRPMLSTEQIRENASTYIDQLSSILDRAKTTVRYNGEWLGKLDFAELVRLTSKMTVAQVMQREDFATRFANHQPISLHELLYPLAQAYDSVAIEADVEMGGQDQTFNILAGRDLQKEMGQEQQVAMFMPLLVGLDGVKKMSKSLGNYVGVAEAPNVMFGKIMSLSDEMMSMYFELCTDIPLDEVSALIQQSQSGITNPKDVKRRLAKEIISIYHSSESAESADSEWQKIHSQHEMPSEIPEFEMPADSVSTGRIWICKLLTIAGLAKGSGEARRLVTQGGVLFNGQKIIDPSLEMEVSDCEGSIVQVGPKRYIKIRTTSA